MTDTGSSDYNDAIRKLSWEKMNSSVVLYGKVINYKKKYCEVVLFANEGKEILRKLTR